MTSPRKRKKRLALLKLTQKQEEKVVEPPKETVVESLPVVKQKKLKTGLVELKPQDQVLNETKEEVKTSTKE